MNKTLILIGALALLAIGGYVVLNAPDNRTNAEKLSDAIDEVGEGFEDAADELDGDRTVGDKLEDAMDDARKEIGESIDNAMPEDTGDTTGEQAPAAGEAPSDETREEMAD